MLHLIYILAFTILAVIAVANLIRNLMMLGAESQRGYAASQSYQRGSNGSQSYAQLQSSPHPELLDEAGNMVNEPFLVMRSISVEDARERLDALYNASPGSTNSASDSHDEP